MDKASQRDILNDIVITGLPANIEMKNDMINNLLSFLGIKTDNGEIQSSFFANSKNQQKNTSKKPMLIIKTINSELKNSILLNYRNITKNKNYIRTSDLGINLPAHHDPQIIHMRNHLSPLQTKLYAEA